jgi:hypothetical protein
MLFIFIVTTLSDNSPCNLAILLFFKDSLDLLSLLILFKLSPSFLITLGVSEILG